MDDQAHDPLALLRAPPTAQQVIEHIFEEIEHAISVRYQLGTRPRPLSFSQGHRLQRSASWLSRTARHAFCHSQAMAKVDADCRRSPPEHLRRRRAA
jgi:hypothetical protein